MYKWRFKEGKKEMKKGGEKIEWFNDARSCPTTSQPNEAKRFFRISYSFVQERNFPSCIEP
jgi:hypothetical protein